jgi:hypothetical protein
METFQLKWTLGELGEKYLPLPHLGYITELNLYNLENELLDTLDFIPYYWRFEKDLKNPSIPCEEKKVALKVLLNNLKEIVQAQYSLPQDGQKPPIYWWWHPELWDKGMDPLEVLKDVCPQD